MNIPYEEDPSGFGCWFLSLRRRAKAEPVDWPKRRAWLSDEAIDSRSAKPFRDGGFDLSVKCMSDVVFDRYYHLCCLVWETGRS